MNSKIEKNKKIKAVLDINIHRNTWNEKVFEWELNIGGHNSFKISNGLIGYVAKENAKKCAERVAKMLNIEIIKVRETEVNTNI